MQKTYKEFIKLCKVVLNPAIKELQSTFMLNGAETRKSTLNKINLN